MRCLYILDINPLLVRSFENTFTHSVNCLFVDDFLWCSKALSLIKFYLFIIALFLFGLGNRSKKIAGVPRGQGVRVPPVLPQLRHCFLNAEGPPLSAPDRAPPNHACWATVV